MDLRKLSSWIIIGSIILVILVALILLVAYYRQSKDQSYWDSVKQTISIGLIANKAEIGTESGYYPGIPWVTPTPMNWYVSNDTPIIGPELFAKGIKAPYEPTRTSGLEVPGSDEFAKQVEAHNYRDLAIKQGKYRFADRQDIFRKKPITDSLFLYTGDYTEGGSLQSDPLATSPWAKKSLREYVGVNVYDT